MPHTVRNPLYHWTHLELKRYFNIDALLDETTAKCIWEQTCAQLATPEYSVHGILKKFRVTALCTTDDPAEDLPYHRAIAASGLQTKVYPTFRPDKATWVNQPEVWSAWLSKLEKTSNVSITKLPDLLQALRQRHTAFHDVSCRLSDHGLERAFADFCTDAQAEAIFDQARAGKAASPDDFSKFATYLMVFFGRLDFDRGWTKQLHIGALRNNSSRLFRALGPDTGFDSIGDWDQARPLSAYLDRLDQENQLPKTIIYNLNPSNNYAFATMLGNFQDGSMPGKIQWGSGWWFLDQKEGIEMQLNALSNLGLLSRFVGMLTDSRSFMSFPRHEYFRRVLCNLLGRDIENGEIPDDPQLVGPTVKNICFANARDYLKLAI